MADDTNDTTPGTAPGVLKTGSDGSLPDLGDRRAAWVWMQDTEEGGGGRFDVLATRVDMWKRKGATVVPNYPLHFGPSARLARPRADLRQFTDQPAGGEAFLPRTPAAGDTDTAPAPAGEESTDQAAGGTAAADTTTRKGGRTR